MKKRFKKIAALMLALLTAAAAFDPAVRQRRDRLALPEGRVSVFQPVFLKEGGQLVVVIVAAVVLRELFMFPPEFLHIILNYRLKNGTIFP